MEKKVRHVLGISGGKDSAALAIYLKENYPLLDVEYYFCDTGKELAETYNLITNLEVYLGKSITVLKAAEKSVEDPFDHYYNVFKQYLPSSNIRWCTKYLKLYPFEEFVGDDPVISYVGIRGDEDREGYISKKSNIQSIFPFRKNIWSEDVVDRALKNDNIELLVNNFNSFTNSKEHFRFFQILLKPISLKFSLREKLNLLLAENIVIFNKLIFHFLGTTNYPLSKVDDFPLLTNEDVLVRADIFNILRESGVGVPKYYEKIKFEVDGKVGEYARSRSGCYFCFFQQKIEWVWLYEQHPELYQMAITYENEQEGFTWNQNESLLDLMTPNRITDIKRDYLNKNPNTAKSNYLMDILDDEESEGCAACFI